MYVGCWNCFSFFFTLYPVEDLSLKMLTFKLISLLALSTAARSQTLSALNLDHFQYFEGQNIAVFKVQELMKTSRPGTPLPVVTLKPYGKQEL